MKKHPLQERHEEDREIARILHPAIETNKAEPNVKGEIPIMERAKLTPEVLWNGY